MKIYKNGLLAAALLVAVSTAYAGDNNGPDKGGDSTSTSGAAAGAVGVGIGVGLGYAEGGSATATGGNSLSNAFGGSVGDIRNTNTAAGGSVLGSGNSSNDNTNVNANTAFGGAGGKGGDGGTGIGFGGSAKQGQAQGQQQSNIGINGQSQGQSTDVSTKTSTSTATNQGQSQSANNAGNSQTVGGQSVTLNEAEIPDDVTIRTAPTMMVSAPNATVSCYKTFGGSLSGILGGAGFSGGRIDEQCEFRETVRIAAAVDQEGATKMLCLSQMYSAANPGKCAGVRPVFLFEGTAARQYKANVAAGK